MTTKTWSVANLNYVLQCGHGSLAVDDAYYAQIYVQLFELQCGHGSLAVDSVSEPRFLGGVGVDN